MVKWPDAIVAVLITIVGSGAFTAFLSYVLGQRSEEKKRKKAIRFLATKICFALEHYAMRAASDHADLEDWINTSGSIGKRHGALRAFPELPESDHYDLFDIDLLHEIYDFPDKVELANTAITDAFRHNDEIDGIEEVVSIQCAALAKIALELSQKIRKAYRLPTRELAYDNYDVARWLGLKP